MTEDLQKLVDEQKSLFDALKKEVAKGDEASKEVISKIEGDLEKYEKTNQDLVAKIQTQEDEMKEQSEVLKSIEKKMNRLPAGMKTSEKSAHYKAFDLLITKGEKGLGVEELKYLRTDKDPSGGFLAPNEYRNELIKEITEISGVRPMSRVLNTSRSSVEFPKRNGLLTGTWVGEGGTQVESESNYGLDIISTKELSVFSVVTHKMINDGAFNITEEIRRDVTEAFAKSEGTAFVNGADVNQPEGFMTNADVASINSGVANKITADSLLEITGELKTGYNPVYTLNRRTLAAIRQLKDGNGQYLWQPGLSAGLPNTINGIPYVQLIDMDDEGANTFPVAFGDFKRAYYIVDGMSLMVIRDDFTLASQGKVKFNFLKSVGAKVVLPEAIKKIKCSV